MQKDTARTSSTVEAAGYFNKQETEMQQTSGQWYKNLLCNKASSYRTLAVTPLATSTVKRARPDTVLLSIN